MKKDNQAKKRAYQKGHWAEFLAAVYLRIKGYKILARRFRTKVGEVDLIARKGDLIAIVEVKARQTESLAINSVSAQSQNRIRAAGDIWLAKQKDFAQLSVRYDIIAVLPYSLPSHFANAF